MFMVCNADADKARHDSVTESGKPEHKPFGGDSGTIARTTIIHRARNLIPQTKRERKQA